MITKRVAIQVLRMPDRTWHPGPESELIDFQYREPAPARHLIGQSRYHAYKAAINEGYEYVGWIDDDDFTNPYYFTQALEILDNNPDWDAIAALQYVYVEDKPNEYPVPSCTGDIKLGSRSNYHGPCVYRISSLVHCVDVLKNFVGVDENRFLAKQMEKQGFNLGVWFSYETFLVRNYAEQRENIKKILKKREERLQTIGIRKNNYNEQRY